MQLYSLVQDANNILNFRNAFINQAISLYLITEPFPKKINKDKIHSGSIISKAIPNGWSSWDRIEIKGPMTIAQFRKFMLEKYEARIIGIKAEDNEDGEFINIEEEMM
jgi:hypothetical protein